MLPFVSFLVPTFGRYPDYRHLVEESVECFVRNRANYTGDCEMILWNDTPGQKLVCRTEGVRVFNSPRFPNLGEKRQALADLAKGDVLVIGDDDDISLPGRFRQAASHIGESTLGVFDPGGYWYFDGQTLGLPPTQGYRHNCSAFTKFALNSVGGYPPTNWDDKEIMGLLRADRTLRYPRKSVPPAQFQTIYRWGVSPQHMSGGGNADLVWAMGGNRKIESGTFEIVPRWRRDYTADCATALSRIAA